MSFYADLMEPQRFISEVKKRPAIWDTRSKEYKLKNEKRKAWDEVCAVMCKEYESQSKTEKNEVARQLLRRWKSLRDSFQRELNRAREVKAGLRRQYIYFNHLKFLNGVVGTKSGQNKSCSEGTDSPAEEEEEVHDDPEEEEGVREEEPPPLRICKTESLKKKLLDVVSKSVEARIASGREDEEDVDRLFLLSLLKDFKKVPDQFRLDLKLDIIQAIKKWQRAAK